MSADFVLEFLFLISGILIGLLYLQFGTGIAFAFELKEWRYSNNWGFCSGLVFANFENLHVCMHLYITVKVNTYFADLLLTKSLLFSSRPYFFCKR